MWYLHNIKLHISASIHHSYMYILIIIFVNHSTSNQMTSILILVLEGFTPEQYIPNLQLLIIIKKSTRFIISSDFLLIILHHIPSGRILSKIASPLGWVIKICAIIYVDQLNFTYLYIRVDNKQRTFGVIYKMTETKYL